MPKAWFLPHWKKKILLANILSMTGQRSGPNPKVLYICQACTLLNIHICLQTGRLLPGLFLALCWQGCHCGGIPIGT